MPEAVRRCLAAACTGYCGLNATFEGLFLRLAPACTGKAVAATRRRFKAQYDARRFGEARATLGPLLESCGRLFDRQDEARLRNDLAVTLYHLGEREACRRTLAPLAVDAALTDAQLRERLPPADADAALSVVRAARTNLKLCAAP